MHAKSTLLKLLLSPSMDAVVSLGCNSVLVPSAPSGIFASWLSVV
jgi:hypothetical protein